MRRILALTRYGCEAASTRQRFDQFCPALRQAGFDLIIEPFFDDRQTAAINGGQGLEVGGIARAYARRARRLRRRGDVDLVWVQYEIFPYLPTIAERLASRLAPVVVDFDDAYYLRYDLSPNPLVRALLTDKMRPLVSSAAAVIAGNDVLADHFRPWNETVSIIPTVVDTEIYKPAAATSHGPVTIGWIGSPTTWRVYVRPYLPIFREICREQGARMLVIGAGNEDVVENDWIEFREWSEDREVADIQEMDIGIMPLPDDAWARGKCGYKLIQYMACGVPTVASPVGVNVDLAARETTGLLSASGGEWRTALTTLILDPARRRQMGENGRCIIKKDFSLASQGPRIVELFEKVIVN